MATAVERRHHRRHNITDNFFVSLFHHSSYLLCVYVEDPWFLKLQESAVPILEVGFDLVLLTPCFLHDFFPICIL